MVHSVRDWQLASILHFIPRPHQDYSSAGGYPGYIPLRLQPACCCAWSTAAATVGICANPTFDSRVRKQSVCPSTALMSSRGAASLASETQTESLRPPLVELSSSAGTLGFSVHLRILQPGMVEKTTKGKERCVQGAFKVGESSRKKWKWRW